MTMPLRRCGDALHARVAPGLELAFEVLRRGAGLPLEDALVLEYGAMMQ